MEIYEVREDCTVYLCAKCPHMDYVPKRVDNGSASTDSGADNSK